MNFSQWIVFYWCTVYFVIAHLWCYLYTKLSVAVLFDMAVLDRLTFATLTDTFNNNARCINNNFKQSIHKSTLCSEKEDTKTEVFTDRFTS